MNSSEYILKKMGFGWRNIRCKNCEFYRWCNHKNCKKGD